MKAVSCRSFPGLVQVCFDKKGTLLEFSVRFAYLAHVLWMSFMKQSRMYLADDGHTLVGFLPDGVAELGVEKNGLKVNEDVSLQGLIWVGEMSLKELIPQKS